MNKERLLKIADHILHGQLGHKVFDFSRITNATDPSCGTAGCAKGEFPIIFPEDWEFNSDGNVKLKSYPYHSITSGSVAYLNISEQEDVHLFYPDSQITGWYGGICLFQNATKEQVAHNILEFIKMKEKV